MSRISPTERAAVIQTFSADFSAIEAAFMGQLKKAFADERSALADEVQAIDEGQIKDLEKQAKKLESQLADITQKYMGKINSLRREQKELRNRPENDWGTPPTGDQLIELKLDVQEWARPQWNKIELASKLDAETAIRLSRKIDVEVPMTALTTIARAVQRELTFAGSLEKVKAIYDQFYALNFRQYGVDIAPKLDEIKSLGEKTGMGMLAAAAVVVDEPKMLAAGNAQGQ